MAAETTPRQPPPSTPLFVATLAVIVITIGVFLSLDLFLARLDLNESATHAADAYARGVALLQQGHAAAAADRFAAAANLERSNVNYALALGEAKLAQGKTEEAEATLKALLDRAENDGAVNLALARVMVREGRLADAKSYYHRAVFGRWNGDSTERRTQSRFELIDLLAREGSARELLAELLPFEEVSPDSIALRRRLGQLFLIAGSPARAANMLREVVRRDPTDAEAYAGMGEAALALGNFRTARADFAEASRLRPNDQRIADRAALVDSVVALDPSARGLDSNQRLERSRRILMRTVGAQSVCGAAQSAAASDSVNALLGQAPTTRPADALGDSMLEMASDVWARLPASCTSRDEVLRLVQGRIAH